MSPLARASSARPNGPDLRTVTVRPRFVWGAGDTSVMPKIAEAVRSGRFAWIGGGAHLTSTTHVENLVEALLLAEPNGRGGEIYFVTDGEPVVFRTFITALLRTKGIDPPSRSVPLPLARLAAFVSETFARATGGTPAVTRLAAELFGREVTIDDAKIRRELGYVGTTTRKAGLAALGALGASPAARRAPSAPSW